MPRIVRRAVSGLAALAWTASSTTTSTVASRPSASTASAVTGAMPDCRTDWPLTIWYSGLTTGQRTAVAVGSAARTADSMLGWHGRSRGSSAYARDAVSPRSAVSAVIRATVTVARAAWV